MVTGVTAQPSPANPGVGASAPAEADGNTTGRASRAAPVSDVVQLSPEAQAAYETLPAWGQHDADVIYSTSTSVADKLAAYRDAAVQLDVEIENGPGNPLYNSVHAAGAYFREAIEGSHFAVIADAEDAQAGGVRHFDTTQNAVAAYAAADDAPLVSDVVVPIKSAADGEIAQGVRAIILESQQREEAYMESGRAIPVPTLSAGGNVNPLEQPSAEIVSSSSEVPSQTTVTVSPNEVSPPATVALSEIDLSRQPAGASVALSILLDAKGSQKSNDDLATNFETKQKPFTPLLVVA